MSRKIEQGDATRRQLVEAAVALFAEHGYAATSTTQIVREANVTRGALYHHFSDKQQVFEAAYIEVEKSVHARCAEAASAAGGDLPAQMAAGMSAFLDACLQPQVQRILILEGPAVLGWERSVRFDDPYCARRLLIGGFQAAERSGLILPGQALPLTHLFFGALNHAGAVIAASPNPVEERDALAEALTTMLRTALPAPR